MASNSITEPSADPLRLGFQALTNGRLEDAVRLFGKAVRATPETLDGRLGLAEALERTGRIKEATSAYEAATAVSPDLITANARAARLHAEYGDPKRAIAYARITLALAPKSVEALCAKALAHRKLQQLDEARSCYATALARAPDDPRVLTGYAALLAKMQAPGQAAELYRRANAVQPGVSDVLASLAVTTELDGDADGALKIYDEALGLAPRNADLIYRRACCIRDLGRFDEAAAAFTAATDIDPGHAPSLHALVRLKRLEDTPVTRGRLARVIADASRPPEVRVQAGFALGETLDRAGENDAAFQHFTEADRLWRAERTRRGEQFHPQTLLEQATLIETSLASEYARDTAGWGAPSDLPVFVVGLPRSGTTLVEQICASHSRVAGVGELEAMVPMTRALAERNSGRERLADWDADHARGLAEEHVADLRRRGAGAARVVNKTPLNLLRLGPIGALFPGARVIWCRRDLRDVVVSQHTMYFGEGNLFSTDQTDCAFAARQIERIGDAWRSAEALPILEVVYEDLVADLETHVRRIIAFLGLEWEPACLDFQNTARHVDTPSSWQVRQPIYSTSVGRWRRFERHLGPMLATLEGPRDQLPGTRTSR